MNLLIFILLYFCLIVALLSFKRVRAEIIKWIIAQAEK